MGRPSLLDQEPQLAEVIAQLYIDGKTNQQIATAIGRGVHKDTITDYRRDARVKNIIKKLTDERIQRITRRIDSVLEARLEKTDKIETDTLLKIRKEMLPERVEISDGTSQADAVEELWRAADKDPELARKLMEIGIGTES